MSLQIMSLTEYMLMTVSEVIRLKRLIWAIVTILEGVIPSSLFAPGALASLAHNLFIFKISFGEPCCRICDKKRDAQD